MTSTPTTEAKPLPELARLTELASKYVHPRIEDGFVFHLDEIATTYGAAAVASLALVYAHASGKWFEHLRNEHMPAVIEEAGAEATLESRTQLAAEVSRYATLLGRDLAELWTTSEDEWIDPESGMHRWDAALAKLLRSLGTAGKEMADRVEEKSRDRAEWFRTGAPELAFAKHPPSRSALWKMWVDPSTLNFSRWLRLLAKAVWLDVVAPRLALARTRAPAVVRVVVADRLLPLMTRQTVLPEFDDGTVRDDKGRVLGRIALTTGATLEAVRQGADGLGTVTGNRLIRALILRSHAAYLRGEQHCARVVFEGGWEGLLEAIGAPSKHHTLVKAIAQAGHSIVWETPFVKHNGLWTYSERRGTRAVRGEVSFTLGDAMIAGQAKQMALEGNTSEAARMARRLVPELRFEPPMGRAREKDQGAIWTLHRLALLELVDHAVDLSRDGAVVITDQRWRVLAAQARLPSSILERTLGAWVEGDDERAPALLTRDGDGFSLADPHQPERDFIAMGGAERARGLRRRRQPSPK